MTFLEKLWWVVLYVFIGIGMAVIFGAAFSIDEPTTTFFVWIFSVVFILLWAMIGVEIIRELSGKNDQSDQD